MARVYTTQINDNEYIGDSLITINTGFNNLDNAVAGVASLSGNWQDTFTTTQTNSGNWQRTFTTTQTNSGNWQRTFTTTQTNSGNWQGTYNTVLTGSPTWNLTYENFRTLITLITSVGAPETDYTSLSTIFLSLQTLA